MLLESKLSLSLPVTAFILFSPGAHQILHSGMQAMPSRDAPLFYSSLSIFHFGLRPSFPPGGSEYLRAISQTYGTISVSCIFANADELACSPWCYTGTCHDDAGSAWMYMYIRAG